MSEAQIAEIAVLVAAGGVIALAAVKLLGGVMLWFKPNAFRIGAGAGDEPVTVIDWSGGKGHVDLGGERWQAVSKDRLQPGDAVVVSRTRGLTLEIRKR